MFSTFKKAIGAFVATIRTERAPQWVAEPVRMIANRVAAFSLTAGTLLVAANTLTTFVPVAYRDKVSALVAAVSVGFAGVTKIAGRVARSKVFSPATHAKMLAQATGQHIQVVPDATA